MDIDQIIRFENGDMPEDETVGFFQHLIDTGLCWQLQGFYGRTAEMLIERGVCHRAAKLKS